MVKVSRDGRKGRKQVKRDGQYSIRPSSCQPNNEACKAIHSSKPQRPLCLLRLACLLKLYDSPCLVVPEKGKEQRGDRRCWWPWVVMMLMTLAVERRQYWTQCLSVVTMIVADEWRLGVCTRQGTLSTSGAENRRAEDRAVGGGSCALCACVCALGNAVPFFVLGRMLNGQSAPALSPVRSSLADFCQLQLHTALLARSRASFARLVCSRPTERDPSGRPAGPCLAPLSLLYSTTQNTPHRRTHVVLG